MIMLAAALVIARACLQSHGVIFVVDSAVQQRIDEAKAALERALGKAVERLLRHGCAPDCNSLGHSLAPSSDFCR